MLTNADIEGHRTCAQLKTEEQTFADAFDNIWWEACALAPTQSRLVMHKWNPVVNKQAWLSNVLAPSVSPMEPVARKRALLGERARRTHRARRSRVIVTAFVFVTKWHESKSVSARRTKPVLNATCYPRRTSPRAIMSVQRQLLSFSGKTLLSRLFPSR